MASIRKEIPIDAPAAVVWDAIRDFAAPHLRITPGVLTDARADGPDARIVTFATGLVVRELLVDLDDGARRVAYAVVEGGPTQHGASMQVFADGERRSRVVWIADFLPHALAGPIGALMEQGAQAMARTLEAAHARTAVA